MVAFVASTPDFTGQAVIANGAIELIGKVLYEPGDALRHVYFPIDCIVSLLYVMEDGASAEISVVGNEGLIGIALFMGGETTPSRATWWLRRELQ